MALENSKLDNRKGEERREKRKSGLAGYTQNMFVLVRGNEQVEYDNNCGDWYGNVCGWVCLCTLAI